MVKKISDEKLYRLKQASAAALPDEPSKYGMNPASIKRALYAPFIGDEESLAKEINRIVGEMNGELDIKSVLRECTVNGNAEKFSENWLIDSDGEIIVPKKADVYTVAGGAYDGRMFRFDGTHYRPIIGSELKVAIGSVAAKRLPPAETPTVEASVTFDETEKNVLLNFEFGIPDSDSAANDGTGKNIAAQFSEILSALQSFKTEHLSDLQSLKQELRAEHLSDLQELREDIVEAEHFKGVFTTVAELKKKAADENDYAYVSGGNVWVFEKGDWKDSEKPVPNSLVPASESVPLQDGTGSAGASKTYARGDHRHPSDSSKVNKSGDTMTGMLTLPGIKLNDGIVRVSDMRNISKTPSEWRVGVVGGVLINGLWSGSVSGLTGYSFGMTFVPWVDASGGQVFQIALNNGKLFYRFSEDENTWSSWNSVFSSNNLPTQFVKKSGDSMTGPLSIWSQFNEARIEIPLFVDGLSQFIKLILIGARYDTEKYGGIAYERNLTKPTDRMIFRVDEGEPDANDDDTKHQFIITPNELLFNTHVFIDKDGKLYDTGVRVYSPNNLPTKMIMEVGSANAYRNVWFNDNTAEGKPVQDSNFQYNPGIGTLKTKEYIAERAEGVNTAFHAKRTDTGNDIFFGIGSGGVNRGIWDTKLNKWIFHTDGTNVYVNGYVPANSSGTYTALTAGKLYGDYTQNGGQQSPSVVGTNGAKLYMMNGFKGLTTPNMSGYFDALIMNSYGWADVPYATAIAVGKNVNRAWIARGGNTENWSEVAELITSKNLSEYLTKNNTAPCGVGEVIIRVDDIEPASYYPNTSWTKVLEGRMPIGANSSFPLGSTGGEISHTLTVEEMPSHSHSGQVGDIQSGSSNAALMGYNNYEYRQLMTAVGGGQSHNNMPPYLAVNFWKRVS